MPTSLCRPFLTGWRRRVAVTPKVTTAREVARASLPGTSGASGRASDSLGSPWREMRAGTRPTYRDIFHLDYVDEVPVGWLVPVRGDYIVTLAGSYRSSSPWLACWCRGEGAPRASARPLPRHTGHSGTNRCKLLDISELGGMG